MQHKSASAFQRVKEPQNRILKELNKSLPLEGKGDRMAVDEVLRLAELYRTGLLRRLITPHQSAALTASPQGEAFAVDEV